MMFHIATDHFDEENKKTAYRLHNESKQLGLIYSNLYAAFGYQKGKGYRVLAMGYDMDKCSYRILYGIDGKNQRTYPYSFDVHINTLSPTLHRTECIVFVFGVQNRCT